MTNQPEGLEEYEWVHCNSCFRDVTPFCQANRSSPVIEVLSSFSVTQCGHFMCAYCVEKQLKKDNIVHCPICSADSMIASIVIDGKIPDDFERYFTPASIQFEKAMEGFRFQQTNMNSLLRFLKDKVTRQKEVMDKVKTELLAAKDLKRSVIQLEEENKKLRQELSQFQAKNRPSSSYSNMSQRSNLPNPPGRLSLKPSQSQQKSPSALSLLSSPSPSRQNSHVRRQGSGIRVKKETYPYPNPHPALGTIYPERRTQRDYRSIPDNQESHFQSRSQSPYQFQTQKVYQPSDRPGTGFSMNSGVGGTSSGFGVLPKASLTRQNWRDYSGTSTSRPGTGQLYGSDNENRHVPIDSLSTNARNPGSFFSR